MRGRLAWPQKCHFNSSSMFQCNKADSRQRRNLPGLDLTFSSQVWFTIYGLRWTSVIWVLNCLCTKPWLPSCFASSNPWSYLTWYIFCLGGCHIWHTIPAGTTTRGSKCMVRGRETGLAYANSSGSSPQPSQATERLRTSYPVSSFRPNESCQDLSESDDLCSTSWSEGAALHSLLELWQQARAFCTLHDLWSPEMLLTSSRP